MGHGTTLFLLGVLTFQQQSALPAIGWCGLIPVLIILGICRRSLRPPVWFACGFLWTLVHAHMTLATALAPELERKDLWAEGTIVSVPEQREFGKRFEFRIDSLRLRDEARAAPAQVRVSWYGATPELRVGDRWRLQLRLQRPRGFANPGGFDYESWLYRKRLRATGYVRDDAGNRHLEATPSAYPLQRLRQRLGERIAETLAERELHGVVSALAIGDRQAIDQTQWEIFRRTGTSHLVAISGLHIGLVAGMVFFLVRWGWSRCGRWTERIPAQTVAAPAAIAAALVYAALAGFSIPTRRALIMICVVMAALLSRRRRSLVHTLMAALLCVLVLDPLAVMDGGFWLSFCAVATILFGMSRRIGPGNWWWRWGRLHVLVTIGLAPVLLVLFRQLPLASPVANFIAVPWVSIGVVPLVLAGTLLLTPLPVVGGLLLTLAERLLAWLWPIMAWISGSDLLQWNQHAPRPWTLVAAIPAVILLLAPRGLPGRWLGLIWLLPALLVTPPTPAAGEFRMTLLDVGQGLATVIRTRDHVLVYDTGARFSATFDAGSAALIPYLGYHGIRRIDTLVISHDDNDHVGGAAALADRIRVDTVLSGTPDGVPWWPTRPCVAGDAWQWDGVAFEFLHPASGSLLAGNDASCVLRIANDAGRVLLTGDIEAAAESRLLHASADRMQADILVAPHHGSRTSSGAAFVAAVDPAHVLFPVGYRNRWHHPHPEIVERYRARGAQLHDSPAHGAITFEIPASGEIGAPRSWRRERARYWHDE